jgi:hypothetical protein
MYLYPGRVLFGCLLISVVVSGSMKLLGAPLWATIVTAAVATIQFLRWVRA